MSRRKGRISCERARGRGKKTGWIEVGEGGRKMELTSPSRSSSWRPLRRVKKLRIRRRTPRSEQVSFPQRPFAGAIYSLLNNIMLTITVTS